MVVLQQHHSLPLSKMSKHAHFQGGWFSTATTYHHHQKQAHLLIFEGGGCSPATLPTTAVKNEQVCLFSRGVVVLHCYHLPPLSKTSNHAYFQVSIFFLHI